MLEHEELYRRIKERTYEANLPFDEGTTPEHKRKCRKRYHEAQGEGVRRFRADLEECFGTAKWASAPKIWEQAWEDGHSYGFHEVYSHYQHLVEVVRPCRDASVVIAAAARDFMENYNPKLFDQLKEKLEKLLEDYGL